MYDFIIKSEMFKWFISNSEGQIIKIWMTFCPCIGHRFIYFRDNKFFQEKLTKYSKKDETFEVFANIGMLTLDTILQSAFSYNIDCQTIG